MLNNKLPSVITSEDRVLQINSLVGMQEVLGNHPAVIDPEVPHWVEGVRSQMSPHFWGKMLFDKDGYPSDSDSIFLMDGILNGFKLVDPGADIEEYVCENYASATVVSQEEMDELIRSEISTGKLTIQQGKPQCVHAMGAIRKQSGKIRNITDCSRPHEQSINNYMSETFLSFKYKSIDTVTSLLVQGDYMAVTDISSAYRSIMIRPCDRTKQGLSWILNGEQRWIVDNFLSFGTRAAPFIFSRLTDAISRHLERQGVKIVNYLDDFIVLGSSWEECRSAQLLLHYTLRRLGFYLAYPKITGPATCLVYLCIEIDSCSMTLQLPQSKLDKLDMEL